MQMVLVLFFCSGLLKLSFYSAVKALLNWSAKLDFNVDAIILKYLPAIDGATKELA
jgi:hypothetical protein